MKKSLDEKESLKLLKEVKSILDKENLTYWLEDGTLLGAIREKRMIPWDTDVDLGSLKHYFPEKVRLNLTKILERKGFTVHSFPEKIDFIQGDQDVSIHLYDGNPKKDEFALEKRIESYKLLGQFFFKVYRLMSVSYYGSFNLRKSKNTRVNFKTNLFKACFNGF